MMEMGDHRYGLPDLRQLVEGHYSGNHQLLHLPQQQLHSPYGMLLLGGDAVLGDYRQHHHHATPSSITTTTTGATSHNDILQPPQLPSHDPSSSSQQQQQQQPQQHPRMASFGGFFDQDAGCMGNSSNGYSQGRWPRQETLTFLEIRSRLDAKFKEAAHKATLWDEVSRIMAEEHGYQRSGKKCREKLENLYKYYKKTKGGRAGRQDGKHYRFFRQLEALYGEKSTSTRDTTAASVIAPAADSSYRPVFQTTNTTTLPDHDSQAPPHDHNTLHHDNSYNDPSFSNFSEFCTTSSSSEEDGGGKGNNNDDRDDPAACRKSNKRDRRRSWRSKIRDLVDQQMKRLMDMQEAWLERMLRTLEHKEQERITSEEDWRKQEAARADREQRQWASERAWIEARDAPLVEALEKLVGRTSTAPEYFSASVDIEADDENNGEQDGAACGRRWLEPEIKGLIKMRSGMEGRFREGGPVKAALWEEISLGMASMGYERSAKRCREKWENINKHFRKTKECNKKRRDNSKTCPYYKHLETLYCTGSQGHDRSSSRNGHDERGMRRDQGDEHNLQQVQQRQDRHHGSSPIRQDCCFRFLLDGVISEPAAGDHRSLREDEATYEVTQQWGQLKQAS